MKFTNEQYDRQTFRVIARLVQEWSFISAFIGTILGYWLEDWPAGHLLTTYVTARVVVITMLISLAVSCVAQWRGEPKL